MWFLLSFYNHLLSLLLLPTAKPPGVEELRVILVGKTGVGKSTAGNMILGREVFETGVSPESVSQTCHRAETRWGEMLVSVVDTPGLFDTGKTDDELGEEIGRCLLVESLPGPHAILLTLSVKSRFTAEEEAAVKWLQANLGEDSSLYTILLFTHVDLLESSSLEDFIRGSESLRRLRNRHGGRYHNLNKTDSSGVPQLLNKIKEMVETNGGTHYSSVMYEKAQARVLEEERKWRKGKGDGSLLITGTLLIAGRLFSSPPPICRGPSPRAERMGSPPVGCFPSNSSLGVLT